MILTNDSYINNPEILSIHEAIILILVLSIIIYYLFKLRMYIIIKGIEEAYEESK